MNLSTLNCITCDFLYFQGYLESLENYQTSCNNLENNELIDI